MIPIRTQWERRPCNRERERERERDARTGRLLVLLVELKDQSSDEDE